MSVVEDLKDLATEVVLFQGRQGPDVEEDFVAESWLLEVQRAEASGVDLDGVKGR